MDAATISEKAGDRKSFKMSCYTAGNGIRGCSGELRQGQHVVAEEGALMGRCGGRRSSLVSTNVALQGRRCDSLLYVRRYM